MMNQPCSEKVSVWMKKCAELKEKWEAAQMFDPLGTWGTAATHENKILMVWRRKLTRHI
jgi:hypothetical protein